MECVPYSKVGGMADVVGSLPAALREVGWHASVLTPYYPRLFELPTGRSVRELASFDVEVGGTAHPVRLLGLGRYAVLVDQPTAFDREAAKPDRCTVFRY